MFGELVCGPPGSGKTTYCEGKRQFLSVYDPTRPVVIVNLDPANEGVFPYPCDVDVRELVQHSYVMSDARLGPNGAYIFCMDVMEQNMHWIIEHVNQAVTRRVQEMLSLAVDRDPALPATSAATAATASLRAPYVIIDCPGQVEFYINSSFMHTLFRAFQKKLECTLCTVHLIDAVIATRDVPTYVSSCLLSLSTMIDHELPHLNILSKWDTLATSPNAMLAAAGDDMDGFQPFLCASSFLHEDFDRMWHRHLRQRRYAQRQAQYHVTADCPRPRLTREEERADAALDLIDLTRDGGTMYTYSRALMSVVDGYGMVGFIPLDVQSQDMMLRVTRDVDNALGNFC